MSVLCSSRAISLLRMLLRPRPLILHIRTANDLDPFCVCCTALLQITDLDKTVCFGVWFLQLRFQLENYLGTTPSLRWWCWHFRAEKYWIFYNPVPAAAEGVCHDRESFDCISVHLCGLMALFGHYFVSSQAPLPFHLPLRGTLYDQKGERERGRLLSVRLMTKS